ncbi:hypothetical protein A9Q81_04405 [Gammaproteobacteria bacterium 42_54_T18]|nr:hypothetical protein A9Q81_04405 [Gammaproteobacteria bacterium 42_54_T18]
MDSMSPDVYVNLLWMLGSGIAVLLGFVLGKALGKNTSVAQLQVLEERLTHKATELQRQNNELEHASDRIEQMQDDIRDKDILLAELNVRIVSTEEDHKQKLSFVLGAKEQLKAEFQLVAQSLLDEKSEKFTALNHSSLSQLLSPLKEQLSRFSKQVSDGYDKDLRDRISLLKELSELKTMNAKMSDDALNLTRALKGDNKLQGNWGEMVLERVLEMSGLQRDREYVLQPSFKQQSGAILRPDAVVQLPEGKSVVVDSKVSLKHWEQAVAAEDDEQAREAMKKHVDSLKSHVKNLSGKQYDTLPSIVSLDFVLMFIPIEAAFIRALDEEPGLYQLANDKNIMLVCPSTLLATLKAIRSGWQHDRQNRNALEIAQRAGALHDQFVLFTDALEDIGDKLGKASNAYEMAHKRLSSGKGSLVSRIVQLEQLGAKTKKTLALQSEGVTAEWEGQGN